MTTFVIHYSGDWYHDEMDTRSELVGAFIEEYASLETMPIECSRHFQWMLDNGESVTHMGSYTYQIRRD